MNGPSILGGPGGTVPVQIAPISLPKTAIMPALDLPPLRFKPLTASWAALHPQPRGVIFFIGGAFFGTFPTVFYRYLLGRLYTQGYTIVAFPFRFTFRHWSVSLGLAQCKSKIRHELVEAAKQLGYDYHLYEEDPNSDKFNYLWLGHSLGCKYIALLELLSDLEKRGFRTVLDHCVGDAQAERLADALQEVSLEEVSLFNQSSILLDPVISDLDNAVPIQTLRAAIEKVIRVEPSREQTYCLINRSKLFGLTSIIAFTSQLAKDTVSTLGELLGLQSNFQTLPLKDHLAAVGFKRGNPAVVEAVLKAIEKSKSKLES